jgi:RNA polymerase sigma-70 factor (ECF subfamily)
VTALVADIPQQLQLIARCRAGDSPAWKELYDAHFDFVFRTARRLGIPDGELDDVVQETFLIAFRKLDSFAEGRFSTWLYRITAHVVSGRHRRRRVREALLSLWSKGQKTSVSGPDALVESQEAQRQVSEVLARMAPKKREVFALFELEGLSGEEIAERVGCRVDTVWSRLHYARKEFESIARKRGFLPEGSRP